jgi:hypothetical protein
MVVAGRCRVLQGVAGCCRALQGVRELDPVEFSCGVLQCGRTLSISFRKSKSSLP